MPRDRKTTRGHRSGSKAPKAKPAKDRHKRLVQRIRRLLVRPLRIVRKGLNLHLVFAATPMEAAVPDPRATTARAVVVDDPVSVELRRMRAELRQRLDRHPLSRTVFVKLAIVERELGRHGYAALQSLPLELLHEALEQLNAVIGRSASELGTLRAKILDAMLARRPKAGDFGSHLALSVFDAPHKLQVQEAGESAFNDAEQEWMRLAADPASPAAR